MKIDKEKFLFMYEETEFKRLKDSAQSDLVNLLGYIEADDKITDERWAAYMLATTFHECAGTWQPISEYGKGKGMKYGIPAGPHGLIYYGRGLTQNTWYENYVMLTKAWNKAHPDRQIDFAKNPDLLLEMEYSYWAMSYAMRNGTYTGVSLKKYFNNKVTDWVNARKIINALDKAELIAGYAKKFLYIVTSAVIESPHENEIV
jgi:putative chitinase